MRQKKLGLVSFVSAVLCFGVFAHAAPPETPQEALAEGAEVDLGPALSDREQAFHALNRLAFGPRPGDVERVVEMGWEAWVREQLSPESIDNDTVDRDIEKRYPSLGLTIDQMFETYRPPYRANESVEDQKKRNELRQLVRSELRDAVLLRATMSNRQFEEVVVEFWRNHFNVDQNKDDVAYMAPNFETQVIRRHAFGKFEDMLIASARHPAMLTYLDNIVSQKPLSDREQRLIERYEGRDYTPRTVAALGRQRGLNENYARELMELHTLGVDRKYKQRDVTELARIFTGWSAGKSETEGYGFTFRRDVHDDNTKRFLGLTMRGGGVKQGVAVLRKLAEHEYTADFIAHKLCRYLIRDEPSEALVEKVAAVFTETDGDLPAVYEAIIFSDDFMFRQNHRVKFKTPFEFVVSSLRATDAKINKTTGTHYLLGQMGQPIYRCEDPTGYYDQAEAWLDPGVMLNRWRFALALGNNDLDGVRLADRQMASMSRDEMKAHLVPGELDPQTVRAVDDAFTSGGSPAAWGVLLGSPEFQQQ